MTRRSVLAGVALLIAFLIVMLAATVVGVASSISSPTDEGTPSGDALSMVGGFGLLVFGLVAFGYAVRVLLALGQSSIPATRCALVAGWALAGLFLVLGALSAWAHFVPLNDYLKPVLGAVLAIAGISAGVASGYSFRSGLSDPQPATHSG